ncbi:MAG: hypothetical protein LBO62_05640, partial [Endomicrobium sp.]|nr:hypothetical protein [Endomicrobium sp.]
MDIDRKFKKYISAFVLNCFLLSFSYGPAVSAVIDGIPTVKNDNHIFGDFSLPYSYGKIVSSHFAASDRLVISIQDLHCHPGVQKNISKIIEFFDDKYGVANVFLEGAYGDIDTSWLSSEINLGKKTDLLDKMLETGRLTGAEYFSAVKSRNGLIKGLESKRIYMDNLQRLGRIAQDREKINLILSAIDDSVKKLKNKYY